MPGSTDNDIFSTLLAPAAVNGLPFGSFANRFQHIDQPYFPRMFDAGFQQVCASQQRSLCHRQFARIVLLILTRRAHAVLAHPDVGGHEPCPIRKVS